MNIQVPWKSRISSGPQSCPFDPNFWVRRKYRDELDAAKPSCYRIEEDLDHLGAVHKEHR